MWKVGSELRPVASQAMRGCNLCQELANKWRPGTKTQNESLGFLAAFVNLTAWHHCWKLIVQLSDSPLCDASERRDSVLCGVSQGQI